MLVGASAFSNIRSISCIQVLTVISKSDQVEVVHKGIEILLAHQKPKVPFRKNHFGLDELLHPAFPCICFGSDRHVGDLCDDFLRLQQPQHVLQRQRRQQPHGGGESHPCGHDAPSSQPRLGDGDPPSSTAEPESPQPDCRANKPLLQLNHYPVV